MITLGGLHEGSNCGNWIATFGESSARTRMLCVPMVSRHGVKMCFAVQPVISHLHMTSSRKLKHQIGATWTDRSVWPKPGDHHRAQTHDCVMWGAREVCAATGNRFHLKLKCPHGVRRVLRSHLHQHYHMGIYFTDTYTCVLRGSLNWFSSPDSDVTIYEWASIIARQKAAMAQSVCVNREAEGFMAIAKIDKRRYPSQWTNPPHFLFTR